MTFSKFLLFTFLFVLFSTPGWALTAKVESFDTLTYVLNNETTMDTIELAADIQVGGQIDITRSVTLKGNGHKLTYAGQDSNNAIPIISISNQNIEVAIDGLTLTGGKGHGMEISGYIKATLTNCTFTGNTATNSGTSHGVGLRAAGGAAVTMANCTFSNNTGTQGAEVCLEAASVGTNTPTFKAVNTVFWNSAEKYITLVKQQGATNYPDPKLYNCAYAANAVGSFEVNNGTFTQTDAAASTTENCVTNLSWTGRKAETATGADGMTHTGFKLTADDTTLVRKGRK